MVCEPEALDPQALDPQGRGARSTRLQLASARHARVEGEGSRHEGEGCEGSRLPSRITDKHAREAGARSGSELSARSVRTRKTPPSTPEIDAYDSEGEAANKQRHLRLHQLDSSRVHPHPHHPISRGACLT